MLTDFGYIAGWVAYLLAALALYALMMPLFNRCGPRPVQLFLRSLLAVVLFTPAMSVPKDGLWAPAHIVAAYNWLQHDDNAALQAGLLMLAAWCVIGLLFALQVVLGKLFVTAKPAPAKPRRRT
ncbi:hypothetical protein ONV78_09410 [Hahella sp. CR1]|uniref:hypothetical protein n=1 Tax=Hahella sp. CR1 TaxID=2992807 RepID=UPI0024422923|nr:hypothetical protein [Hahella sp. CR1]MDG9667948.1 hypothetical protein [Hahella sp. CR1]